MGAPMALESWARRLLLLVATHNRNPEEPHDPFADACPRLAVHARRLQHYVRPWRRHSSWRRQARERSRQEQEVIGNLHPAAAPWQPLFRSVSSHLVAAPMWRRSFFVGGRAGTPSFPSRQIFPVG